MKRLQLLIIDDDLIVRNSLNDFLSSFPYDIFAAECPTKAFAIIAAHAIDIALIDINLPEMSGIEFLKLMKTDHPDIEAIMITARNASETVIQTLRYGAFDYITKPLDGFLIQASIERTKHYIDLMRELKAAEYRHALFTEEVRKKIGDISGNSILMREAIDLALQAAASPNASVMITGESGTGKELFARLIHYAGARKDRTFLPVNCAAIPESLVESELFGHSRGAFTNAHEDKAGYFERADSGTIFLDEIGDMPFQAQSKMLRVLEDRIIHRIGSSKDIQIDVRVISATNKNISALIDNTFRSDLLYRLNTIEIALPPLRERKEDIPELINHYIRHYTQKECKKVDSASPEFHALLSSYHFPGNVRELKNIIERAVILCSGNMLLPQHLPFVHDKKAMDTAASEQNIFNLDIIERRTIAAALKKTSGNKSQAAELLQMSRPTLNRKLKKYNLE
ncbi:MAG: sigma-54-dependent Fis family transcriptional regulator [Spirochaetes bacterium]|nr:sigma-54-dependent Fis family transcriptional regulator [Spirochaetota bacterium]